MQIKQAAQVVFGNVEAQQSPRGGSGYHLLYSTRALLTDPDVADFIEPRCSSLASDADRHKLCYFTIPDGRAVVVRCASVETTDRFNRVGSILAHGLVISEAEFRKCGNDPFAVIDSFRFHRSIEEAQSMALGSTGDYPAVDIEVDARRTVIDSSVMRREQLIKLLLTGLRYGSDPVPSKAVGFLGRSDLVIDLLRHLFSVLPAPARRACSFDSSFSGLIARTPYWVVGLPDSATPDPRIGQFDIARGEFVHPLDDQPSTAFENWLAEMLSPSLSEISACIDEAFRLCEVLEATNAAGGRFPEGDVAVLMGLRPMLTARLHEQVRKYVGESLAEVILPYARESMRRKGWAAVAEYAQGIQPEEVEAWMTEHYLGRDEMPSVGELEGLQRFIGPRQNSLLYLIYLRWTGQWPLIRSNLVRVGPDVARSFARWALKSVGAELVTMEQPGVLPGLMLRTNNSHHPDAPELLASLLDYDQVETPSQSPAVAGGAPAQVSTTRLLWLYQVLTADA